MATNITRANGAAGPMATPQRIPGGAAKYRSSAAYLWLKELVPTLDAVLQQTGSLISGSSVLAAILNENWDVRGSELVDVDWYVPIPHDKTVKDLVRAAQMKDINNIKSSSYCNSFLRRNGIRTVNTLISNVDYPAYEETSSEVDVNWIRKVDIMSVRKRTTPLNVVRNFDLTFCQVWYNGKDVWATHPQHITTKKGEIQGDYVTLYLSKNRFLRKRVHKYIERGFSIRSDSKGVYATQQILKDLKTVIGNCGSLQRTYNGTGADWARRMLFRAARNEYYMYPYQYSKTEDGYDSDEYAADPNKLIQLAGGTREQMVDVANKCLIQVFEHYGDIFCDLLGNDPFHMEGFDANYFIPLINEIKSLCENEFVAEYGPLPNTICHDVADEPNESINYNNDSNYVGNNGSNNGNNGSNNGNNGSNNGNNAPVNNTPLPVKNMPTFGEGTELNKCFNPVLPGTNDITSEMTTFYTVMPNGRVGNAACLDADGLNYYKTSKDYLVHQCTLNTNTLPMNSLFVARNQLVGVPLRRLELAQKMYVKDSEFQKVQEGKSYLLEATANTIGRIVSDSVIRGGTVVSADHCQTVFTDPIYSISEVVTFQEEGQRMANLFGAEGGRLLRKRLRSGKRRTYKKRRSCNRRRATRRA